MSDDPGLRVSDQDRDEAVELLRGHLLAGRLEPDEHEERVAEACRAKFGHDLAHALRELPRPAPPAPAAPLAPLTFVRAAHDGRPGTSLVLGITGVAILLFTFGMGSFLALPLSVLAWTIGARAAREPAEVIGRRGRTTAQTGMRLGALGTLVALLALFGYAALFFGL